MKVTKSIVSGLVVLAMAFALVSSSAASGSVSATDADPGYFLTGPYPCGVESPAYTDYINARPAPCTTRDRDRQLPEFMGSPF